MRRLTRIHPLQSAVAVLLLAIACLATAACSDGPTWTFRVAATDANGKELPASSQPKAQVVLELWGKVEVDESVQLPFEHQIETAGGPKAKLTANVNSSKVFLRCTIHWSEIGRYTEVDGPRAERVVCDDA
jgi:hypothetical protein